MPLPKILIQYGWGGAQDSAFSQTPQEILLKQLACKYHFPSAGGGTFWKES